MVHPEVERVVICEIEPLIPTAAGQFFAKENHRVMKDRRVEVVNDDARSFFTKTEETFDLIVFGYLDSHTTTSLTNARLDSETNEWVINGEKIFITNGKLALDESEGLCVVWDREWASSV